MQSLRHAPRKDGRDEDAPIESHQLGIGGTISCGQNQFLHHRIVEHKARQSIHLAARRNSRYHEHCLCPLPHQRVDASYTQGSIAMQSQLHLTIDHHTQVLLIVPLLHVIAQLQLMIHTHLFVRDVVAVLSKASAELLQLHHIVHTLMVQTWQLGCAMQLDDRPYHEPAECQKDERIERIFHPPQMRDPRQLLADGNHVTDEHQHDDAQDDSQSNDDVSLHNKLQ